MRMCSGWPEGRAACRYKHRKQRKVNSIFLLRGGRERGGAGTGSDTNRTGLATQSPSPPAARRLRRGPSGPIHPNPPTPHHHLCRGERGGTTASSEMLSSSGGPHAWKGVDVPPNSL